MGEGADSWKIEIDNRQTDRSSITGQTDGWRERLKQTKAGVFVCFATDPLCHARFEGQRKGSPRGFKKKKKRKRKSVKGKETRHLNHE